VLKSVAFIIYYQKETIFSMNAIAAALETDKTTRSVDIIFIREKNRLLKEINSVLKTHEIVIIGFSIFTTQFWEISEIIKKIRKKYRNKVIIIAGGPHPSGMPKQTLNLGVNVVFIGESEKSIIKFIKQLQKGAIYQDIKGIASFNQDKTFIYNKKDYIIDLNQFPPFPLLNTRFGTIEITRGCPYLCHFCQTPFIMGVNPRYRNIKTICKYIKLMKKENLTDIRFIAPNAFSYGSIDGKSVNIEKLENLLSEVRNIIGAEGKVFFGSFPSEVRPEHVNDNTLELIKQYTDNENIIIGAQSGSQRMLDFCHRGHKVKHIYEAVKKTIQRGLEANVDFIFGLPNERKKDRHTTLQVMKDLIEIGAKIHAHTFMPLPNTPFARSSVTKIDKTTRSFLKEYNFRGYVYGNWNKQEKLGNKISELLRNNLNN